MAADADDSRVDADDSRAGAGDSRADADSPANGDDSRSLVGALTGVRARALLALVVLAALVASGGMTVPLLVAAAALGALALAVVLQPGIRTDWRFNVLVGLGVALYGVAYGLAQTRIGGQVLAAAMVVVGLLVAANHLGIAPWSDSPRRR